MVMQLKYIHLYTHIWYSKPSTKERKDKKKIMLKEQENICCALHWKSSLYISKTK